MAVFLGKLKAGLEWVELGKTAVELLLGLFAGQTVKALLMRFTNIPSVWITPIWLGAATALVALFVFLGNRKKGKQSQSTTQTQVVTVPAAVAHEPQYKNVEEFYKTYDNSMLMETEEYIRKESNQYRPGTEREQFLIRQLASSALTYIFDIVWYTVYRSQLEALQQLNARPLSTAQLKTFYDEAARQYPGMYPAYSFDSWLEYLRAWLMLVQQGDTFSITVRGKEFLKYLVHQGRLFTERAF